METRFDPALRKTSSGVFSYPSAAQNTRAPDASGQRSSRRRQRPPSSELSVSEPKRKRQRGFLSGTTFLAPGEAPEMEEKNARVAVSQNMKDGLPPGRDLVARGKKLRSGERTHKSDGSTILSSNDMYTVARLPALPDRLRSEHERRVRQHGAIDSDSGYALTLTHSNAIVWPYAVNTSSPETFVFALSNPSKHTTDHLPLGTLVSASASSSNPGLVVAIPTTGKVTYWESVSSAATLDLRLKRNGVELSIPGMLSGETVIQLLNAESAGFILAFSTGRIAYMSVRDGQGRPAISVQFLKAGSATVGGGIFGSLRNVLSSSKLCGDLAAIRAGCPEKVGERDVVVATTKGKLQCWNIHRGGHTSLTAEIETREKIVMAMKSADTSLNDLLLESFELLDLTFTPKSMAQSPLGQENNGTHLVLLSSLSERHQTHFFLVEAIVKREELIIQNMRALKSYKTPLNRNATCRTRLYLPNPALVAYVIFDQAVVVISMAKLPDSADLQLLAESHLSPPIFEDVIDFRDDVDIEIVGSGMEEPHETTKATADAKPLRYKAKHPATILLVRGGGVVRVAAIDVSKLASNRPQQVTAKTKLEQAVFYGSLEQNPLRFAVRSELQFSSEEVGAAALELSDGILRSETMHIPSVPASIDQNLRKRSDALQDLAVYIRESGVTLDRVTKWKLLWNAEKMKAATLVWEKYNSVLKSKPAGERRGLLTEVVESIHENYKSEPVPEAGELDRVRHWFIKDIWNLEIAVPWAYQVIKYTWQDGQKDHSFVLQTLSEANDLVISALEAAFKFRTENLDLYGLSTEQLQYGVLKTGYEGLPEFWTSTCYVTENTRKQSELAGVLLDTYYGKPIDKHPNVPLITKIRNEHGRLVDVTITSNTERIRWNSAQESLELRVEAEEIRRVQSVTQEHHLSVMATGLRLAEEAIDLAEKHELLPVLASLLKLELDTCSHLMRPRYAPTNLDAVISRRDKHRARVQRLFEEFGMKWATALFELYIAEGSMSELLNSPLEQQAYLTEFLRQRPEYAKVSWINDIIRERNFGQASQTLVDLGIRHEQDLWTKKISLSIGKLSLFASQDPGITSRGNSRVESVDHQLNLIKIQYQIYEFVQPVIANAIDENAELELALESYGNQALRKQPAFQSFLEERMSSLINHKAMDSLGLIDLLTLMDTGTSHSDSVAFTDQQFYLALKASCYHLTRQDRILTQRIIWRRCILRDDWVEINNTNMKDDEEVSAQSRGTILYKTLRSCFEFRLFDRDSDVMPMSPLELLGAGSEGLDQRFKGLDASIIDRIMKDMQVEDQALLPLLEKSRLEQWHKTVLDLAKLDFESKIKEETNSRNRMQDAEQKLAEIEQMLRQKERGKANISLQSKARFKARGTHHGPSGGFQSSMQQY